MERKTSLHFWNSILADFTYIDISLREKRSKIIPLKSLIKLPDW